MVLVLVFRFRKLAVVPKGIFLSGFCFVRMFSNFLLDVLSSFNVRLNEVKCATIDCSSAASIEKMVVSALTKSIKDHAKAKSDETDAEKSMKEYILSVVNTSGTGKGKSGAQIASATTASSTSIGSAMIQSILKKAGEKSSGNSAKNE